MLYLRYIAAELRRRGGRTILTALGLGVGVGLVVAVTALSAGLDDAQSEVLAPLTGVGTDMTVKRPVQIGASGQPGIGGPAELSPGESKRLRREGAGPPPIDFSDLGDPGEKFSTDQFATADLSFPAAEVRRVAAEEGVQAVSPALTLDLIHLKGRVPDTSSSSGGGDTFAGPAPPPSASGGAPGGQIGFQPTTITGIDAAERDLGLVKAEQVTGSSSTSPHRWSTRARIAWVARSTTCSTTRSSTRPKPSRSRCAWPTAHSSSATTAPGIPASELPQVFDRFHRGAAVRDVPGSGLGLAIVRQVAEAHGGSAEAANADDGGAVFTLRLPQAG